MKKMKTIKDSQPWSEREKVLLLLLLVSVIDIPSLIDTLYQIGYEFGQALALWFQEHLRRVYGMIYLLSYLVIRGLSSVVKK